MPLLKDIINEATAKETNIPRLLRLCLTLAYRLQHKPLLDWVRYELDGYPKTVPLPRYRIINGRNRGQFLSISMQGTLDIPTKLLPEEVRKDYETVELRQSISEYVNLVKENGNNDGCIHRPWPVEMAIKYASKFITHGQCISAWTELSASELVAMADKITTKVLNFALEIEAEAPDAGEIESADQPVMKEERVTQIFKTTIQGNIQNYSAGGSHFQQTAVGSVQQGNLESLISFLRTSGLAENDLNQLEAAIKRDQDRSPSLSMGEAVKGWLGEMALKAGQGLAGIGADVVSSVVVQAILKFLGIST